MNLPSGGVNLGGVQQVAPVLDAHLVNVLHDTGNFLAAMILWSSEKEYHSFDQAVFDALDLRSTYVKSALAWQEAQNAQN